MRPIKLSKKDWGLGVVAVCLALSSLCPSDPYIVIPMLLGSGLACAFLAYHHEGSNARKGLFLFAAFVVLGFVGYRNLSSRVHMPEPMPAPPRVAEPKAPSAPTMVAVISQSETPVDYTEKKLVESAIDTPCSRKGHKAYSFDELGSLPGGASLKKPWIVAKPLSFVSENRQIVNIPQLSTPPGFVDLMFEISVMNRGESSVAKDWMLCMVENGKAAYYKPQEILPSDLASHENKVILERATTATPIERGHLVVGWISFRVPQIDIQRYFAGSIEYRDYLEELHSTDFAQFPGAKKSSGAAK